jgi:hypothetical protein
MPELSARDALRHREVRGYLFANSAMWVALLLQAAVVGKQVFDITDSEL